MAFYTEIECDSCNTSITRGTIVTKGEMVRTARSRGWSVGKYHLCPTCRKERNRLKKKGLIN